MSVKSTIEAGSVMKLPIDTSGMTFMAAAPARPVTDFETRQHKADENGELLYNLQVVALDPDGAQIITVKVPGDPRRRAGRDAAARGAGGDAVVDERALGRRVPREPDQGRSASPAARRTVAGASREGRGVGRAACGGGRQWCTWSTSWLGRSGGSARGSSSRRCWSACCGRCGACASSWPGARARRAPARGRRGARRRRRLRGRRRRARRRRWRFGRFASRSLRAAARDAAFGGRGRGRRSTRASRLGRSGARACGRSLACPPAICSRVRVRRGQSVADLDARREQLGGVPSGARGSGAA